MSNVIDFAAVLNNRRAAAQIAERETAKAARIEKERAEIAETLGGTIGAQIIADVVTDLRAKDEAASAPKFMPAYCDPENEKRGSKYDATRGLSSADIAARIRNDIKAEQKAGRIAKGFKISTRKHSYSGGYSIDVTITAVPEGFRYYSEKAASWNKQFPNAAYRIPLSRDDQHGPEYLAIIEQLRRLHGAYNRDNSDSMVDYFDTRFYGDVSLDWQLRDRLAKAEIAASPGDVWADNAGEGY